MRLLVHLVQSPFLSDGELTQMQDKFWNLPAFYEAGESPWPIALMSGLIGRCEVGIVGSSTWFFKIQPPGGGWGKQISSTIM